jgi:hypothetical protein
MDRISPTRLVDGPHFSVYRLIFRWRYVVCTSYPRKLQAPQNHVVNVTGRRLCVKDIKAGYQKRFFKRFLASEKEAISGTAVLQLTCFKIPDS